jgi:hypothetical protein
MRWCAAVALSLLSSTAYSQKGVFYNYSQWDRMEEVNRVYYLTGVFDSLVIYAADERTRKASIHYYTCIRQANMDNGQLANNVQSYVRVHPDLQEGTVQLALVRYLAELCGPPPE